LFVVFEMPWLWCESYRIPTIQKESALTSERSSRVYQRPIAGSAASSGQM
jgi:hypothetical protein